MTGWNFAQIWEAAADHLPSVAFAKQGDRVVTWQEADRRADGIAATLLARGARKQDKVAQYLYNCPEYLESVFACFKAGLVPVNTNYRYTADELIYLWTNADAVAVVFHGAFTDTIAPIREQVPGVGTWLWVDDGTSGCPAWATPYEPAASASGERVVPEHGRDGDDIFMLYTGGTTGMPKGVMWRQDDLAVVLGAGLGLPLPDDVDAEVLDGAFTEAGPVTLPSCPLMHGTGAFAAFGALCKGGTVVLLPSRHFDPAELLDTVDRANVSMVAIVGDAFAKPILAALEAEPERWTMASVQGMLSSGVMWSESTKRGLLDHHPDMLLLDAFSSSEALGMGQSISGGGAAAKTAAFSVGANTIVVDDDGNRVPAGSGDVGRLAVGGRQPIGYYKDPEKSARTFITVEGRRYSCPGDYASVDSDGTITVLGRGSVCINTGGEKVFPEEVEEVIKTHPAVRDAVVVGVPDERFGEAVVAVVETRDALEHDELIAHVRSHLAPFKCPRQVVEVDTIGRAPNGKVDYARLRDHALTQV